jgi:hypothetical protein
VIQPSSERENVMITFEERLERLEKSQKRYQFATIGLLCLMVEGVSMG